MAPILLLSVLAVAIVLITGCIDADEAFEFIDGSLLALIFAMLAIGAALEASGAVALIANGIAPDLGPAAVLYHLGDLPFDQRADGTGQQQRGGGGDDADCHRSGQRTGH